MMASIVMLPLRAHARRSQFIWSSDYWGHSGVQLQQGRHYQIKVIWSDVVDGETPYAMRVHSLEGWPPGWQHLIAWPLSLFRRRPFEPWFSLIATIDREDPQRLRTGHDYVACRTGELICYFNDLPWAYGNNHGGVWLEIVPAR